MVELPSGSVTFLFTDIEGSTTRWEHRPEAMSAALARHDALLRAAIAAHGGTVFKTVGDAFCAAFLRAASAVAAALAAQQAIWAEPWGDVGELRVRMALHTGVAEERDDDYFGPPLNRVARLLSTGYGGQTLLSAATEELVHGQLPDGVALRDMGEHRLKDLVRPEHIYQLIAAELPADFPPLKTLDVLRTNLPSEPTSFVGRERELAAVKEALTTSRLVTLLGPGGIGKTRLSLQVGAELLEQYPDGVWFLELAPLSDPALVPQALASAMGVRETPGTSLLTTLTDTLRTKRVLVLLDNCEHVVAACAQLANALLRACPDVRLLASSREVLAVPGETVWRVPSLPLPDPRTLPPLDQLMDYAAVRLFVERAQAAQPAFALTEGNAPAVVEVCRHLDGIALAIELAAARVKMLAPEQINARLTDRFRLLTGGSRTALPRQQTLRALIDWSHDLLAEPERAVLRRLAVFAGGFELEAAEAACAGDGVDEYEVMDLLAQLVDKSLVHAEEPLAGATRYRQLESIREYGREKLEAAGETAAVSNRHLEWYLALAERAEPELTRPEQGAWLDRLEMEHDNLRAALEWSQTEAGGAEAGLRIAGAIWRFWHVHGYMNEGRRWLDRVLASSDDAPLQVRANALNRASALARNQGDFDRAAQLVEAGLALYRQMGEKRGIAGTLINLGNVLAEKGDRARAAERFEEGLTLYRDLAFKPGIAIALLNLGLLLRDAGEYGPAMARYEEALAIGRTLGDKDLIALLLTNLGTMARDQGDYERATELYEEGLSLCRAIGNRARTAQILVGLGTVALDQGRDDRAATLLRESLFLYLELGDKRGIAACLKELAGTAVAQRQAQLAAQLLGAETALREAIGRFLTPQERSRYGCYLAAMREQLGEAALDAAWARGQMMPLDDAITLALAELTPA